VTISGSFLGGGMYDPQENRMLARMVTAMLDQGTERRDKMEIREMLASVGAAISFACGTHWVRFAATCLKQDMGMVVGLLAEQLREPAFKSADLDIVKQRVLAFLEQEKEDTGTQAKIKLSQMLYAPEHPNYIPDDTVRAKHVRAVTPADLKEYHASNLGLGTMTVVAVGDVDAQVVSSAVTKAFGGWRTSPLALRTVGPTRSEAAAATEYIPMTEKTSVDVIVGQPVGIDVNHPDRYPLGIATKILGEDFSGRLMTTVRDEQGLTYAVYSGISGIQRGITGHWFTWGTFAPTLLKKGEQAVLEQVRRWTEDGVTNAEVAERKENIIGSYKVGLATTGGLADAILTAIEEGRSKEYLDEFPKIIAAITPEQVNEAVKKYIDPERFVLVAAGSIDKNGKPL